MTRPLPVRARGEGPTPRLHTTKTQRCDAGNRLKNLAQLQSTNRSSNQIGKQYSSGRNIRKSPAHLTHGLKVHAHSVSGRARLRGVWRAGRATRFYRRYFLNYHMLLVVRHKISLHKKKALIGHRLHKHMLIAGLVISVKSMLFALSAFRCHF